MAPIDGLWIDMNEVSNFCNGECTSLLDEEPITKSDYLTKKSVVYNGFDPNNPPYSIDNQGNKLPLNTRAIATDAKHYGGILEYNVHNLFGKYVL